jgi:hypothetical protein
VRKACWLLAVLVVACGQPAPPAGNGSCRLPISIADSQGNSQGAFVSFPSGKVTLDTTGVGGVYYDRPFARWLPINGNSVSSDGARYAYLDRKVPGTPGRARLHLVDVRTGTEKLVELGAPEDTSAYVVVSFTPAGIWLSQAGYESPNGGLYLLEAGTAVLKDVGGPGIFEPVAGAPGVFWFTDGGPVPQQSAGMGSIIQARMQRLTISDGKTETWLSEPGSYLTVLGTDLVGHPIFTDGNNVRLALSPSEAKVIGLPQGYHQLTSDRHGVWFGGQQGIFLFSDANGLQKVSNQPGYPVNGCF